MTRPNYPPEFDGPDWCEVCGKAIGGSTSECQCPKCPVCDEVGNLECFGTHMGALPERFTYEVMWDNGKAYDSLGVYDSKEEAERVGQDWLMGMIAVDSNPAEAAEDYSYEVKEPEPAPSTPEDTKAARGDQ